MAPLDVVDVVWACASRPLDPRQGVGDVGRAIARADGTFLVLVDGVGHGAAAAVAANAALAAFEAVAGPDLSAAVNVCHEASRVTRGASVGLAWVNRATSTMTWLGVGNVSGVLHRPGPKSAEPASLMPQFGGTVGRRIPVLQPAALRVAPGDVVVLATDGLNRSFIGELPPPFRSERQIAERLIEAHATGQDDACVLVARIPADPC